MRRETILKITSALIGLSIFTMLLTPVLAGLRVGNNRWGYASDAGGPLPDGELITAWIDGVQYGDDLTVNGDGLFSVDTPNDSDYGLGTEKTGGLLGDYIYYVHGDLTSASGGVFMTGVSVPEPFEPGGFEVFPEDLAEDPFTPELLKISKISVAPIPYIGIYDASGAATITDYALDINNGGAVQIAAGDIMDTMGLITYIDPTSFGGISNDDAITLSEFMTGYTVDRVEFGIINVEPQETMMNNAPNPPAGMEIHRTPADGSDTNDCSVDFVIGAPPPPPTFPTATGPVSGWTNVANLTITYTGNPVTVNLWYSTDDGVTWIFIGTDPTVDGTYDWTIPADGQYSWYTSNGGVDPDPVGGELPEAGTFDYDGSAPIVEAGADMTIPPFTPTTKNDTTADGSISGIATILWTSVPPGVIFNPPNALITDVSSPSFGPYICTLTVTDNAGNVGSDFFTLTHCGPGLSWDLYNGQNFRTYMSYLAPGWTSEDLAVSIIIFLNTNYGEGLVNEDVEILRYNSVTGLYERCYYWTAFSIWWGVFPLIEGDTYIIQIAPGALSIQPRNYELPSSTISSPVTVDIYNGMNLRGFPVTSLMDSEQLAVDIISYINTNYGESLVNEDIEIIRYNSITGLFERCYYWTAIAMWWGVFPLNPVYVGEGYIVQIAPGALSVQPRAYTPS